MPETYTLTPIAHIQNDFPEKFGIPRQSGLVEEVESLIVFEPDYRNADALRGIEGYSHLWLLWVFSQAIRDGWSPTVLPPRLGGKTRMGVFATRSPFRPNALGLSCVKLLAVEEGPEGLMLKVGGADLMDGTPIFDIKPYIPYADCKPEASCGFAPDPGATLRVTYAPGTAEKLPPEKRPALTGILANDPRPRYQHQPERLYALDFAGHTVRFTVDGDKLTVTGIE